MSPHGETQDARDREAWDDDLLRIERPAAERRQQVSGDPEAGQQEDVHLRVAEEPEHMVPEERTALGRGEEYGPKGAVRDEQGEGRHERRERPQHEEAGENPGP